MVHLYSQVLHAKGFSLVRRPRRISGAVVTYCTVIVGVTYWVSSSLSIPICDYDIGIQRALGYLWTFVKINGELIDFEYECE